MCMMAGDCETIETNQCQYVQNGPRSKEAKVRTGSPELD